MREKVVFEARLSWGKSRSCLGEIGVIGRQQEEAHATKVSDET